MSEVAATPPRNLALQGGGSHGALTWGVLDALLEDGGFTFEGISGTSAGAMNAVALAHYGLAPADVIAELERREGTSGIEEKALRKVAGRALEEGEAP